MVVSLSPVTRFQWVELIVVENTNLFLIVFLIFRDSYHESFIVLFNSNENLPSLRSPFSILASPTLGNSPLGPRGCRSATTNPLDLLDKCVQKKCKGYHTRCN